jgi:ATP-dependent Lhr-like helicase
VAEWLRREAAVDPDRISSLFGIAGHRLDELLGELVEEGLVIRDLLLEGSSDEAVIDAQNLEILLRRARAAARPSVASRPPSDLARFALRLQGAGGRFGEGRVAVLRALAALEGAALPAGLWESEILPVRVMRYSCADLDAALSSSPWQWFGAGKGLVAIAAAADLELYLPLGGARKPTRSLLLPQGAGSSDFWAIRERSGLGSAETARRLWSEAWKGLVASDSFRDLREGLANGFGAELPEASAPAAAGEGSKARPYGAQRRIPRALRERWRGGAPVSGRWFALDLDPDETDPEEGPVEPDLLEGLSLDAARARILASRYGLLCRSVLERELPGQRWGELFPALRRLELAGELLAGRFFDGLEGPQFLDPALLPIFLGLDESDERGPVWINALDPAAAALYALSERSPLLPARIAANRICVDAGRVLAVSSRSYRELAIEAPPEDPRVASVLALFSAARERDSRPERRIIVESVNGLPSARSPYAGAFRAAGFEADRGRLVLW